MTFSEREYIRGRGYQDGHAGLKLDSAERWCARCSGGHICARGLQRAAHAAFGEHPILANSAEWSERLDTYTVGYLEGAAFQLAERARLEQEGTFMRTKQPPILCSIHLDEHETPCSHPAFYQLISDNGTEYPVCRKHGDDGVRRFGPRVIRLRRITRR